MSAKHTAGPWVVGPNSIGEDALIAAHSSFVVAYAAWNGGSGCELRIKNPADARLIAAAPDLLAALHGALSVMPVPLDDHDRSPNAMIFLNARAAVTKATGA